MNQINNEFSQSIETKDNLFSFTRNFEGNKREPDTNLHDAHENVLAILDRYSPGWNCQIVDMRNIGKMVLITAALTVAGVTRHGIGTAAQCTENEILRAEKRALACAAKKFSFVREAIDSDDSNSYLSKSSLNFPVNPIAQSFLDLITAKQISIINSTSRDAGVDAEKECSKMMSCAVGELSRKAAAYFISHLHGLQKVFPVEVETVLRRAG